jgi:hypothetical protein
MNIPHSFLTLIVPNSPNTVVYSPFLMQSSIV